MLVSIVVPTFNRLTCLDRALESISFQTETRFEVVVVNDGGANASDVIARWARQMSIQYIDLPLNAGLARARNMAIQCALGDVLCFLDDDDVMLAGHLKAGAEQLARADTDAVHTHVAVCDQFIAAGAGPTADQIKAHYDAAFDGRLLQICNFMPVNAVFIRKREDVPIVFDEDLRQLEDWDLWLRLHVNYGYRFSTVPMTTTVYHRLPGSGSMTDASHSSADAALRFRESFRAVMSRYPSDDSVVRQGRELHDHYYGVVAQASASGKGEPPFLYERFVALMDAFVRQRIDGASVRQQIDSLFRER